MTASFSLPTSTVRSFAFTPADWFKALAAKVVVDGKVVDNPYKSWHDVNADLPDQEILAFIPGTKHGTREVFDIKVLEDGCKESGALEAFVAAMGEKDGEKACLALRTDGASVDIDGDYTETLAPPRRQQAGDRCLRPVVL